MRRKVLIGAGAALLCLALCLAAFNWDEDRRAGENAQRVVRELRREGPSQTPSPSPAPPEPSDAPAETPQPVPDYVLDPDMEMPVTEIDGHGYIGTLEVPVLELTLPVMDAWSYPDLKLAPCRYQGSAYRDDLIVAGHDYRSHFGHLDRLQVGDEVRFTDADGNAFLYAVAELTRLEPTAVEELETGDWDLTLFTCASGGAARLAVRCTRTGQ